MSQIRVDAWKCDRGGCGHIWIAKDKPRQCARCKCRNWDLENGGTGKDESSNGGGTVKRLAAKPKVLPPVTSEIVLMGHKGETVDVTFPTVADQAVPFAMVTIPTGAESVQMYGGKDGKYVPIGEPITNSCSPEAKEARRVKKQAKKAARMKDCLDALPSKVPARMQERVMAGKLGIKCPHGWMNNVVCRQNGGGC